MPANQFHLHRVVIFTAIPVEYRAVRSHLSNIHEEMHSYGTIYERGIFTANYYTWDVVLVEIGAGNTKAAIEVERAINYFQPGLILFVGVAGGLKDVQLGDVVAATKIYAYDFGKVTKTFEFRPEVGATTYRLQQRARAEARKNDWLNRIQGDKQTINPRAFVGPIAAGNKVIASKDSPEFQCITSQYSDTLAVEMEGNGFIYAAHASDVDALLIRGISDLIEYKHEADANNYQDIASRHASAFAFELLAKLDVEKHPSRRPRSHSSTSQKAIPTTVQREETKSVSAQAHLPTSASDADIQQDECSYVKDEDSQATLPSDSSIPDLLLTFQVIISTHIDTIKKSYALFSQDDDIYKDHCDHLHQSLNRISEALAEVSKQDWQLNYRDKMVMTHVNNQLDALRTELRHFREHCSHPRLILTKENENNCRQMRKSLRDNLGAFMHNLNHFHHRKT